MSTHLNRWVSADPLTVHGLGADLNVYAYVSGQTLKAIDPVGLCPNEGSGGCPGTTDDPVAPDPSSGARGAPSSTAQVPRATDGKAIRDVVGTAQVLSSGPAAGMSLCGDAGCKTVADPNASIMVTSGVGLIRAAPKIVKAAPKFVKSLGQQINDLGKKANQWVAGLRGGKASTDAVQSGSGAITRTAGSVRELTRASPGERAFAHEYFSSKGYNVELAGKGKAGADIRVLETGQRYELKQLTTANPSKVATRINEALRQGPNAIIDLRKSPLTNVQALMGYREAARKGFVQRGQTVRIITKHGLDATF